MALSGGGFPPMNKDAPRGDGWPRPPVVAGRSRAFTLVEMISVVAITGILGVAAVASLGSVGGLRASMALSELERTVDFARERSLSTAEGTWIVFGELSEVYSVLGEDPASPGRAHATVLADPAGAGPYTRTLGAGEFAGVEVVSASFDGGTEIGFDGDGRPRNSEGDVLLSDGSVALSHGYALWVERVSGRCWRETP